MMNKISEPVIIIKKNKKHLNPRFKNLAASEILPIEQETGIHSQELLQRQDANYKQLTSSLGSDNDSEEEES